MKSTRAILPLVAVTLLLASCSKPPVTDRAGRLLSMAGEEAASIQNKMDRFTRQLHIAETQLRTDRKPDAAKTLALAQETLKVAGKDDFDDFHRIAAWTSISQLSRQAGDRNLAVSASDLALAALNDVQPATERPLYVLSLAGELADLRGKDAAVELINSGGAWAAEIMEPTTRRLAITVFAERLLAYEDFESARTMLRRDRDPVWRTDMFLSLANVSPTNTPNAGVAQAGGRGGAAGGAAPAPLNQNYGRDVRYENVYQSKGRGQ
jgi:hypothetical protein